MAEIAMILYTPLLDSQTAHLYLRGECHCQNCDNKIHNHGHHQGDSCIKLLPSRAIEKNSQIPATV